ncbi:MAG: hypothetical protein IJX28_01055 [Clostridia bacterium]|nr:hypothetical protein [Clostridia bacterium]
MKTRIFTIAGATVALSSTVALISYGLRKRKDQDPSVGILLAGVAGFLLGAVAATAPGVIETNNKLKIEDILDDEDAALMNQNITEVLSPEVEANP